MSIMPLTRVLVGAIVALSATLCAGQTLTLPPHISKLADVWLRADPDGISMQDAKQVDANKRLRLWYDRSGNGNNLRAATQDSFSWPKFVQGGTENGLGMYGQNMVRFGENGLSSLEFEKPLFVPRELGGFSITMVVRSEQLEGAAPANVLDMGNYPFMGFGISFSRDKAGGYTATDKEGKSISTTLPKQNQCADLKVVTLDVKFARPSRSCPYGTEKFEVDKVNYCTGVMKLFVNGREQTKVDKIKLLGLDKSAVNYYSKLANAGGKNSKNGAPAIVGGTAAGGNGYFRGDLGELLFFGRAVGETERMDTELYLMRKFYINPDDMNPNFADKPPSCANNERDTPSCASPCAVPATFSFNSYDRWNVFFNGMLLKSSPIQTMPSGLQTETVSLPKFPSCGDVLAVHSEILADKGAKFRGIKGQVLSDSAYSNTTDPIAVTDSTWRCSASPDEYPMEGRKDRVSGYSHEKWTKPGYPDHSWDTATWSNGALNNPQENPGNAEAKWIWALNNVNKDNMYTAQQIDREGTTSGNRVPTNATSSFCRLSFSVAVDSIVPDEAVYNSGDLVTVIGRGFGYNDHDHELPSVVFPTFGPCSNVQRLPKTSRKLTCNVPKLGARSSGTSKEAHVSVQRLNEYCNMYDEHPEALEVSALDVASLKGIREAYTKPVPFTFKCSCTPDMSPQPPHQGYRECTTTTCAAP